VTAAVPARVVVHDRHAVGITSDGLVDLLKAFYEAGVRRIQVIIDVAGQRLAADAAVYRKIDRRSGRVSYWLYPLGTAQTFLRDLLQKHRGDAPRNAKRPLPVAVVAVVPRPR
jgi:hypothetical protein